MPSTHRRSTDSLRLGTRMRSRPMQECGTLREGQQYNIRVIVVFKDAQTRVDPCWGLAPLRKTELVCRWVWLVSDAPGLTPSRKG